MFLAAAFRKSFLGGLCPRQTLPLHVFFGGGGGFTGRSPKKVSLGVEGRGLCLIQSPPPFSAVLFAVGFSGFEPESVPNLSRTCPEPVPNTWRGGRKVLKALIKFCVKFH